MQRTIDRSLSAIKPAAFSERAAVWLLFAAAVAAPLMLGASGPWSRFALEATMACVTIIWALCRNRSVWLLVLALGCFGLAWLQLVPLPDSMLTALAPVSAGAWKVANAGGARAWGTISIDPAATAVGMRRMLLWLGATMAIKDMAAAGWCRRTVAASLALSAAVIWILAIALPVDSKERKLLGFIDMNGPTSQWWMSGDNLPVQSDGGGFLTWATVGAERYRYDEVLTGEGFGPYLTSNQFAGALCVMLPFLLAACLEAGRRMGRPIVGLLAVAGLMVAATWTLWERAGSRAGTAALLLTQLVFVAAITENRWGRRISGGAVAAYGMVLFMLIAGLVGLLPKLDQWFPPPLQAKLAAFLQDPRAVAASVAARMFMASPVLGTGINSYSVLYPRFDPGDYTLYYAYNDYTQLLAETGLIGVVIAIALATPVISRFARLGVVNLADRPFAAASAASIAGLAAHMAFEWNLHQPANSFLACIAVGLFLATVPGRSQKTSQQRRINPWVMKGMTAVFVAACGASLVLLARDARSDAAVRTYRQALMAARPAPAGSKRPPPKPLLENALRRGDAAMAWDQRNSQLALMKAQAHLHMAEYGQGPAREAERSVADHAFRQAQRRRAIILGLPEPLPAKAAGAR